MNDLSLERTAAALAAFNTISDTVSDMREEDTDRAFKMTMLQFQMDAEAKRQEHEMLLGAHLTAMKDLAQKRYELNNQNMMLGGIVKGLDSEGGQNAVNMVLGNISQQSEYINDEDDFHANAIGEIQQASLKLQDEINILQAGMSEYFKGYNDTAAAHKAMGEFATSEGETGMAKYTISNEELGKLSEALGFKPDSPEAKGVAAFANNVLSGQYADFDFKEGELGTKKMSAEADMMRARASMISAQAEKARSRDITVEEYDRTNAAVERFREENNISSFDEAWSKWREIPENKDSADRYQKLFDLENQILDNSAKWTAIENEALKLYPDNSKAQNRYIQRKAIESGIATKSDFATISTKPGWFDKFRHNVQDRALTDSDTGTTKNWLRVRVQKLRDPNISKADLENIKKEIRSKYPDFDAVYEEELENTFGENGRAYDQDAALNRAMDRIVKTAPSSVKIKGGGW
jgi:hypothetical protein